MRSLRRMFSATAARRALVAAALFGLVGFLALGAVRHVLATPPPPPDYNREGDWLCRPGRGDPCGGTTTTAVFEPNGARRIATSTPAADAPVDCFYVYPTVSRARTAYAPIAATAQERAIARRQLAPFASVCRPFAPLYRQVTTAGLGRLFRGARIGGAVPYADVVAAWRHYLAKDNGGRRFVLIGHSQGAGLLARLIAAEIDGTALQSKLVAAILPGATIDVPVGRKVGGTFAHLPLCRSTDAGACVIAYSTYAADRPMPANARFGMTGSPGMRDACVDPARLAGTSHLDGVIPLPPGERRALGTDFAAFPGAITAACRWDGRFSVLAIAAGTDVRDGRSAARLIEMGDRYVPATGFHSLDLELAVGSLQTLIRRKTAAAS